MPPPVLIEPASIDCSKIVADRDAIMRANPQRFEFQLLDAIVQYAPELLIGYHDVKPDAWWCRAHIPGRPIFPGVLMIEAAAQLASFAYRQLCPGDSFLGFAGVDRVKFRGAAQPPCRLILVGKPTSVKPRRMICDVQGFIDGVMVFESEITGMPI